MTLTVNTDKSKEKIKVKIDIHKMFINLAESLGDFENGSCVVDNVDDIIIGAMLEQYYQNGLLDGLKKYNQIAKDVREKAEFDKMQGKLFDE